MAFLFADVLLWNCLLCHCCCYCYNTVFLVCFWVYFERSYVLKTPSCIILHNSYKVLIGLMKC